MMSLNNEPSPSNAFDAYQIALQEAAVGTTKSVVGLPRDLSFHRSLDRKFGKRLDACSARILSLTATLLEYAKGMEGKGKGKRKLESEDVVDGFHVHVVDTMDHLLERTDTCLDEFLGRTKPPAIAVNPQLQPRSKSTKAPHGRLDPALAHASHLPKPQLLFRTLVDNSGAPWRPKLKKKPHALISLEESLTEGMTHPYQYEITHFPPPAHLTTSPAPAPPESLISSQSATYIAHPEQLPALLAMLKDAREIAVDLEHHSYRSFAGFVCLMQLSTRTHDWIVDCLDPGVREELECLNEVFTDPKIMKVLHGAESDIVWLQQNFNLYIVNLFDTYHATKVLDFPKHSLSALLEMYCDFTPDKRFQLADWRIRPLPEQMLLYARADTHFLLFIYDNLRQALTPAATAEVLRRSAETSLRTYSQVQDAGGWETLGRRWNRNLTGVAGAVFRAVHTWRENVARAEDESTRYVLPNHYVFLLAERQPEDLASLFASFQGVPPLVRVRAEELLALIREAVQKAAPDQGVSSNVEEEVRDVPSSVESLPLRVAGFGVVGLWDLLRPSLTEGSLPNAAKSSSLIGREVSSPPYTASTSSLFGSHAPSHTASDARYRTIAERIHASLVIAPMLSLPPSQSQPARTAHATTPPRARTPEPIVQTDIPSISSTQPRTDANAGEDEEIVVVGRSKKRKRRDVPSGSATSKGKETLLPDFDYSTAPNILDEHVPVSAPASKKKRREKSGGVQYGSFGAPPRNRSEMKGGNQARTFR